VSDVDIMLFVSDNILKIYEVRKLFTPFFIESSCKTFQTKLSSRVKSAGRGVHFCELTESKEILSCFDAV